MQLLKAGIVQSPNWWFLLRIQVNIIEVEGEQLSPKSCQLSKSLGECMRFIGIKDNQLIEPRYVHRLAQCSFVLVLHTKLWK